MLLAKKNEVPDYLAIAVLRAHMAETADLHAHVEHARSQAARRSMFRTVSMLDGMADELMVGWTTLHDRVQSLSSKSEPLARPEALPHASWRFMAEDNPDPCVELDALLSEYARYARSGYDSIGMLEQLGDPGSIVLLNKLVAIAEKGLCFLELYLEGLALHIEDSHLPAWPKSTCTLLEVE